LVSFFGLYAFHGEQSNFYQEAKPLLEPDGAVVRTFDAHLDNIMRLSSTFANREGVDELFGKK
jgi:hypothetical protein